MKRPSELMPRVRRGISLLKRLVDGNPPRCGPAISVSTTTWTTLPSDSTGGTHGAAAKLFFRLAQQAGAIEPVRVDRIRHTEAKPETKPQAVRPSD
jgi:hypothetical protein